MTSGLSTLAEHLSGLVATKTSTPLTTLLVILVGAIEKTALSVIKLGEKVDCDIQVGLSGADEGSEFTLVLRLNVLGSNDGSGLLVDDSTETGLALDDDVGDTHLAAESGEEDNKLDGVNIVGDDDKGSLLGLDEGNTVVQTVLDEEGLLRVLLGK